MSHCYDCQCVNNVEINIMLKIIKFIFIVSVFFFARLPIMQALENKEIEIVGTGNSETLFQALAEDFSKSNTENIVITIPKSIGSKGAIHRITYDKNIFGRIVESSHNDFKKHDISYFPIARTPISFFVNGCVELNELTSQNIIDIYSGKIQNWVELNAPKAKIKVLTRQEEETNLHAIKKFLPGFESIKISPKAKTILSDRVMVNYGALTHNAIGFGSFSDIKGNPILNPLSIDGIAPTNVEYPIMVNIGLIYKEEKLSQQHLSFLNYLKTAKAKKIITQFSAIPLE